MLNIDEPSQDANDSKLLLKPELILTSIRLGMLFVFIHVKCLSIPDLWTLWLVTSSRHSWIIIACYSSLFIINFVYFRQNQRKDQTRRIQLNNVPFHGSATVISITQFQSVQQFLTRVNRNQHSFSLFLSEEKKERELDDMFDTDTHKAGTTQFTAIYDAYNFALVSVNWLFNGA